MEDIAEKYRKEIVPQMMREMNVTNVLMVPKLLKIVIHCSMGEALADKNVLKKMQDQLAVISGQRPAIARAKRAISTFKLRAGDAIGLKITLRGRRMFDFLTKLVTIALPRVRDFRGVSDKSFDGKGNYTLGITEQTIFPELEYRLVDKLRGFEVTFVTSAHTDSQAKILLQLLGIPFEKGQFVGSKK